MTLFDFQCKECNNVEEQLVSTTDPNPPCSKCQGATDKLFTCGKGGHYFNGLNTRFVNGLLDRTGCSEYKD
jgi:putative FmdB family regulatory protein